MVVNEERFYSDIVNLLQQGREKALTAVNSAMVETYWRIGKRIVEEEQSGSERAKYGEYLLTNLSRRLTDTLGKGFSYGNLRNFRQFYLVFPSEEICYTLCSKLSWSHLRLIMRLDLAEARNYYIDEAHSQNWTVRVLERNIKTEYYKRLLSTRQNTEDTEQNPANEYVKDPYVLEFLGLPESIEGKETAFEKAIIGNLRDFLLEMGRGFSFVARQFRISTETSHFYIDLVFYNYLLKCFVVIDLKTTKLTHQDIGQIDMYVRMFDDLKRGVDDNPTIGIILCADKDETIVKYSVLNENRQIFASKYLTVLPSEEELTAEIEKNVKKISGDKEGGEW
jgi:predicted nuclease of restriction endonuclease-like (RecB) superfamily